MLGKTNYTQVHNNITNITNTNIITTTDSNTNSKSKPSPKPLLLYVTIAISIIITINISIVISYNCNNPQRTVTVPINKPSATQPPIVISSDYYTETIVHGSKTALIFNNNKPIIKITIPQYETAIVTNKLYADSQEITQTTKTIVKIADITHIYYPNANEYEEVYATYIK